MTVKAFMDFDGVFNAIPVETSWIGPDEVSSNGFEVLNPRYWRTERVTPNLETHFELDRQVLVSLNGKDFHINYSSELVDGFKELIANNLIDFVWATYWRENAVEVINPVFDFPDHKTSVLHWQNTSMSVRNPEMGKVIGVSDYLESHVKAGSMTKDSPIIWVDDVATMDHVDLTPEEIQARVDHKYSDTILAHPHLIIRADTKWGISRDEFRKIKEFVGA